MMKNTVWAEGANNGHLNTLGHPGTQPADFSLFSAIFQPL